MLGYGRLVFGKREKGDSRAIFPPISSALYSSTNPSYMDLGNLSFSGPGLCVCLSNETTNLLGVCADADKRRLLICLECVWMRIKRDCCFPWSLIGGRKETAVFPLELNAEKRLFLSETSV